MKTHKGTAKRVKVTGSGKLMVRRPNPKRGKRSRSKLYSLRRNVDAHKTVTKALRKKLPNDRRAASTASKDAPAGATED
jgi:ribosomal protein L35